MVGACALHLPALVGVKQEVTAVYTNDITAVYTKNAATATVQPSYEDHSRSNATCCSAVGAPSECAARLRRPGAYPRGSQPSRAVRRAQVYIRGIANAALGCHEDGHPDPGILRLRWSARGAQAFAKRCTACCCLLRWCKQQHAQIVAEAAMAQLQCAARRRSWSISSAPCGRTLTKIRVNAQRAAKVGTGGTWPVWSFRRRFCRFAAGLACISHKKKATFWRDLIDRFPRLIDFLCNTENVGQVLRHPTVAWQCVQAKGRVLCACP